MKSLPNYAFLAFTLSFFSLFSAIHSNAMSLNCSFTAAENVCIEQNVLVTYTGNVTANALYTWDFDNAVIISGSGQGPYQIKWLTTGEKHITLKVKYENDSCSNTRPVMVHPYPAAFEMTGGGTYPQGGAGVHVGVSGSQVNVIYTLFRNQVATTNVLVGNGQAIDFGLITEPGNYSCKARFDGTECATWMAGSVNVTVSGSTAVSCTFSVAEVACIEQNITVTYTGNATANAQYQWNFDNAQVLSGSGQGPYVIRYLTTGEKHITLKVKQENDSCTHTRAVIIRELPQIFHMAGGGSYLQGGAGVPVGIAGSQVGVIYSLFRNEIYTGISLPGTGQELSFGLMTEPGTYTCKARWDGSECWRWMEGNATVTIIFSNIEVVLCMVTFDTASLRNLLVWNKPQSQSILQFNIFKETYQNNVFVKIAEVPYSSFSAWVDTTSDPLIHSNRYKISATDINHHEYEKSPAHKTIHLNIVPGPGCYNLIWNHYEGFEFLTYRIFRRLGQGSYELIDSVASNINSYTDFYTGGAVATYYIEVLRIEPCNPSAKSIQLSSVISNTAAAVPYGIDEQPISELRVSPNPFNDDLTIRLTSLGSALTYYSLLNTEGRQIKMGCFSGDEMKMDCSDIVKGLYLLRLKNDTGTSAIKILKI